MTLTLGEMIETLEQFDKNARVKFDNGNIPGSLHTWRGDYRQLTLTPGGDSLTVKALLNMLRVANGKTFIGYKGGEFLMDLNTPVWADAYGEVDHMGIVAFLYSGNTVIIVTRNEDPFWRF